MAIIASPQINHLPKKPYPKLMRYKPISLEKSFIVLFRSLRNGTVVQSESPDDEPGNSIGSHSNFWNPAAFEDYNQPLTLQNE